MATLKTRNPFGENFFEDDASAPSDSPPAAIAPLEKKVGGQRLNIEIDPGLHKALKRKALEEDRTVSDILRDLIEHYLRQ